MKFGEFPRSEKFEVKLKDAIFARLAFTKKSLYLPLSLCLNEYFTFTNSRN